MSNNARNGKSDEKEKNREDPFNKISADEKNRIMHQRMLEAEKKKKADESHRIPTSMHANVPKRSLTYRNDANRLALEKAIMRNSAMRIRDNLAMASVRNQLPTINETVAELSQHDGAEAFLASFTGTNFNVNHGIDIHRTSTPVHTNMPTKRLREKKDFNRIANTPTQNPPTFTRNDFPMTSVRNPEPPTNRDKRVTIPTPATRRISKFQMTSEVVKVIPPKTSPTTSKTVALAQKGTTENGPRVNVLKGISVIQKMESFKSRSQNFEEWITKFKSNLEVAELLSNGQLADAIKLAILKSKLDGGALELYLNAPEESRNTFDKAIGFLEDKFTDAFRAESAKLELMVTGQMDGEKVAEFADRIGRLTSRAYKGQSKELIRELCVENFVDKLRDPELKFRLQIKGFTNIDNAVKEAIRLEHYLHLKHLEEKSMEKSILPPTSVKALAGTERAYDFSVNLAHNKPGNVVKSKTAKQPKPPPPKPMSRPNVVMAPEDQKAHVEDKKYHYFDAPSKKYYPMLAGDDPDTIDYQVYYQEDSTWMPYVKPPPPPRPPQDPDQQWSRHTESPYFEEQQCEAQYYGDGSQRHQHYETGQGPSNCTQSYPTCQRYEQLDHHASVCPQLYASQDAYLEDECDYMDDNGDDFDDRPQQVDQWQSCEQLGYVDAFIEPEDFCEECEETMSQVDECQSCEQLDGTYFYDIYDNCEEAMSQMAVEEDFY